MLDITMYPIKYQRKAYRKEDYTVFIDCIPVFTIKKTEDRFRVTVNIPKRFYEIMDKNATFSFTEKNRAWLIIDVLSLEIIELIRKEKFLISSSSMT
jgi:hypothetical protein